MCNFIIIFQFSYPPLINLPCTSRKKFITIFFYERHNSRKKKFKSNGDDLTKLE